MEALEADVRVCRPATPPHYNKRGYAMILTPELLEASAAVVSERGLCRWAYTDETEAVCILGAVAVARGYSLKEQDRGDVTALDAFVEEPMAELAVLMGRDPVAFSDDKGRTAEDVAVALRTAANKLRRVAA